MVTNGTIQSAQPLPPTDATTTSPIASNITNSEGINIACFGLAGIWLLRYVYTIIYSVLICRGGNVDEIDRSSQDKQERAQPGPTGRWRWERAMQKGMLYSLCIIHRALESWCVEGWYLRSRVYLSRVDSWIIEACRWDEVVLPYPPHEHNCLPATYPCQDKVVILFGRVNITTCAFRLLQYVIGVWR